MNDYIRRPDLSADPNNPDELRERYENAVDDASGHPDCERCVELQTLLDEMRVELAVAGVVFDV